MIPALKKVDPDSPIWASLSSGSSKKMSYTISDDMGPLLSILQAKQAVAVTWSFDTAATTKHNGLAKEFDLRFRFWNEGTGQVCDRLFKIMEMTKETYPRF